MIYASMTYTTITHATMTYASMMRATMFGGTILMMQAGLGLCAVSGLFAECLTVGQERLRAGELAEKIPLFAALPPDLSLAPSPLPGIRAMVSGRELERLARRNGLTWDSMPLPDLCLTRAVEIISSERFETALRAAVNAPGATIELIDFTRQALPPGRLEFPRSGLSLPPRLGPHTPVIWRGRLIYDQERTAPVWARVRIAVERPVLMAAEDLRPGQPIRAEQIEVLRLVEFPFPELGLNTPAQALGKIPRRVISAGQRIAANALEEPYEIARGDKVTVRIVDGLAQVRFETAARSGGRRGDSIQLENPMNGRTFRASVEGKGTAILRIGRGI